MPRHRHSTVFHVVNRAGRYLSDTSRVPFTWTDREAMALAFRSYGEASDFIEDRFHGPLVGKYFLGLRVVT